MRKLLVTLASIAVTLWGSAEGRAGQIWIGLDKSAGEGVLCHIVHFEGPGEASRSYEEQQKERFEPVDPAVLAKLKRSVVVRVEIQSDEAGCVQTSGTPQKVVLTEKGSTTPVLAIQLDPEPVTFRNMLGATFTAVNGAAKVDPAKFVSLKGRELEFHLVYSDHVYRDRWRSHYAAEVLR
jgi:hypothetical protein